MEKSQLNTNLIVLNEKLLKSDINPKSYKCHIVSKTKTGVLSIINLDFEKRLMIIKTEGDITIQIKFSDILAMIPLKEKEEAELRLAINKNKPQSEYAVVNPINPDNLKASSQAEFEEFILSNNSSCAQLNFFPLFSVKRCNCCGWICCTCKETIIERRAKVTLLSI